MCLIALAIDQSRRFPLVLAANRDEFFARPTARLAWWTPAAGGPSILGGRDLESGGTWLGLTAQGRMAMVTNVRGAQVAADATAPSRGLIVPRWLACTDPVDKFWMHTALSGHNGFNLIAADFKRGECFWASNQAAHPVRLERGTYTVSNAALDTVWPKTDALKVRLRAALASAATVDALSAALFTALTNRDIGADADLPSTGVPLEQERLLSAAFIRTPDRTYGTRCSTLVISERVGRSLLTHVFERTYPAGSLVALLRRITLKGWPPRYDNESDAFYDGSETAVDVVQQSEFATEQAMERAVVSESQELSAFETTTAAATPPTPAGAPAIKRTRVRTLLKPTKARRSAKDLAR
jgi:uncharacterized protein with NRDE domain